VSSRRTQFEVLSFSFEDKFLFNAKGEEKFWSYYWVVKELFYVIFTNTLLREVV